jgi:hypothetical protein
MSKVNLAKLERDASAATPGEWEVSGTGQSVLASGKTPLENIRICESHSLDDHYPGKTSCWNNIAHIANNDPATSATIYEALRRAERALDFYATYKPRQFPEGYYEINVAPGEGGHVKFGTLADEGLTYLRERIEFGACESDLDRMINATGNAMAKLEDGAAIAALPGSAEGKGGA